MGEIRDKLLNQIDRAHDWHRGKASQWEVCGTKTDSFCGVCGLRWTAYRDGNHSANFDVFETAKGERRTLREVSELESCVVRAE